MSEHGQSGAVRLQALALIAAACVTTGGAVVSAFIQSGWISRPSPANAAVDMSQRTQASFMGIIEPVNENSLAGAKSVATAENRPATFNEVAPSGHLRSGVRQTGGAESQYSWTSGSFSGGENSFAPRTLPSNTVSKPLMATN